MRSIQRRFNNVTKRNTELSSYVCFARAIKGQRFIKQMISRWFYKLVEEDDYSKNDRRALLSHLDKLSNPPEGDKN